MPDETDGYEQRATAAQQAEHDFRAAQQKGKILPISNDIVDIPVQGMFASADWRIICCDGENYYKACGRMVREKEEGGHTTCVKPLYHLTGGHEDFDGYVTHRIGNPESMEAATRRSLLNVLKETGLEPPQAYNVLNAMVAEGFKITREFS